MTKTFAVNEKGKIEFTPYELTKLLNEVWSDGRKEGSFTWMSPYPWTTPTITCGSSLTSTYGSSLTSTKGTSDSVSATNTAESTKTATIVVGEDSVGRKK